MCVFCLYFPGMCLVRRPFWGIGAKLLSAGTRLPPCQGFLADSRFLMLWGLIGEGPPLTVLSSMGSSLDYNFVGLSVTVSLARR